MNKRDLKTIVFYGALGKSSSSVVGGGEIGNLRTIDLLLKSGATVLPLYKPYPWGNIYDYIAYPIRLLLSNISLIYLFIRYKIKYVHVSGFYSHLIYFEFVLITISKIFNKKVTYELRGGGVDVCFNERTFFYKCFFKLSLMFSDSILVQGSRYIDFIGSLTNKPIYHYPNFVQRDIENLINRQLSNDDFQNKIKLIYFGRLTKSKNISASINICKCLLNRGYNAFLTIVGDGDENYINDLKQECVNLEIVSNVRFIGPQVRKDLFSIISECHFFLFPSTEIREGQSNALTEAMSLGLVPVCSDNGFSKEIVKFNELVISGINAEEYCSRIVEVIESDMWGFYSMEMMKNVSLNYTESNAINLLEKLYRLK